MSADERSRERFARAWSAAVEGALPPLDLERGAVQLANALQRRKTTRSRSKARFVLAAAAVLAVVLTVASFRFFFSSRGALELTVDGKQASVAERVGSAAPHLVRFSDGSTISLEPESSLEVTEVDSHRVGITMRHGAASFDVVHSDESAWQIGAGPFKVRVLGTAFRVVWQAEQQRFSVSVTRGAVRVGGPLLGGERVISAGVTCAVDLLAGHASFGTEPEEHAPAQTAPSDGKGAAAPPLVPSPAPRPRATSSAADERAVPAPSPPPPQSKVPASTGVDWRDLERQGQFDRALQEAQRTGIEHLYEAASAEDLMGLARAARLAGRLDIAKLALLSCRRRFAGTQDAAMAAYLLGRSAASAEAARWFSTYLEERPDGALAREASGRLLEAQFQSGQQEAARAQARAYLLRYPSGPHADFAKMVLQR